MEIEIINYDQRYLDQILKSWNENLIYDPINEKKFLKSITYDPNFDPKLSVVAIDKDTHVVIGYCHAIHRKESYFSKGLEHEKGWINFIFVNKEFRRKGIGSKLVDHVTKQLVTLGVKTITLSAYSPNYMNPGIDIRYQPAISFFERIGYSLSVSNSVSMQRSLWDFSWTDEHKSEIERLRKQGITIRPYEKKDYTSLMKFLVNEFDGGWVKNFLNSLNNDTAEDVIIISIDIHSKVNGFCMRAIDGNPTRFGPIGVAEKERSLGLGGILFDSMMISMKKNGLLYTNFLWTSGDAIRFYERHGMEVYREYKTGKKEL